ncbi:cytochrome c [Sphingobacterium sp. UT-1RO-CII-1]|uniref:c-type cytochrome n=1 Tax=Sphingobacterium sp. UT-1RO-CII-1 TaxID=2995225 RepID=UPI00227B2D90|nr:cytochrome c [Sphingobacterium sp. UT-1RO-CII-1]MCY4779467.1 cytochrome c [Sphingobacterium sp. UT-1RO-CII-1]
MKKHFLIISFSISMLLSILIVSCQPNVSIETAQYAVNGQKLYITHCQNCHGAKGEGLGTLYPPLTDSTYLRQNRHQLASIVKFGMQGAIEVAGKTFDNAMPGIKELSNIEIAYILTYVTTTFGKDTKTYTQEEVQESLKGHQ